MKAALQVAYAPYDRAFLQLAPHIQTRIQARIDDMGLRLDTFPHQRLQSSHRCKLRVGDFRVIYVPDLAAGIIHLLGVGHRREIYKLK